MALLLPPPIPYYSRNHPFSYTTRSASSLSSTTPPKSCSFRVKPKPCPRTRTSLTSLPLISAALNDPLDLTEENVRQVLADARTELAQIFDTSVGITGEAEVAEIDGPVVKLALRGRFWHERSTVLARLSNYLKNRIPEILEVDIEDERQLDDSPENF